MTPDERADRAERVIVETIAHFKTFTAWFQQDAPRYGDAPTRLMTYAADELARHARIAGIPLAQEKDPC